MRDDAHDGHQHARMRIARGEYPLRYPQSLANMRDLRGLPLKFIIPGEGLVYVRADVGVVKGSSRPNAGKLFIEFLVSEEGQKLFQKGDYIPVDPAVPPLEARLRPDGQTYRALFLTPEELEASLPRWFQIFKDVFK